MEAHLPGPQPGVLRLLVLQPTPFCNIDCSYCYLAQRNDKRRMSVATATACLQHLYADGLIGADLDVCWHLGEPLAAGLGFYEEIIPTMAEFADGKFRLTHTFQTNATLIDEAWCTFFRRVGARVGVSLDGPARFHDRNRLTRTGAGTHARTLAGLRLLQRHGIDRYIIAVLGPEALREPEVVFEFFAGLGETNICFNIEETEGINNSRAAQAVDAATASRSFFRYFLDRLNADANGGVFWVRDLQQMLGLLTAARPEGCKNENNTPLRVISVTWDGFWTTYSPELITTSAPKYDNFRFGNLAREPVSRSMQREPFISVASDIASGVARCRAECSYFSVCGGGAPSNKFSELGSFDGTETFACRSMVKSLADGCLDFIEQHVL